MKTTVVRMDPRRVDDAAKEALREAGRILKRGGLVVFPTETVYGLGADAFNEEAAAKIYEAKGRPSDNPLIVHIADVSDLDRLLENTGEQALRAAKTLADAFWPGPLTMVLNKTADLPLQTTGGLSTVAVRLPANETARMLIREGGGFVAAPSANVSGRPSPTSAAHCIADLDGRVDMILDGGDCVIGLESTIVDLTGSEPEILRPGKITEEEILAVLGLKKENMRTEAAVIDETGDEKPRAPGMKYRHYAPQGVLTVVQGEASRVREAIDKLLAQARTAGRRTGVIVTAESEDYYRADAILCRGCAYDREALAHNLYRVLRGMDEAGVQDIFFELPDREGCTDAIINRLYKACGGRVKEV